MANFEAIKDSIDFQRDVAPVIAITLNPIVFNRLKNIKKEAKREKKEREIWNSFKMIADDSPTNNYMTINNFSLVSPDDDIDPIIDAQKCAIIPYESIGYIANQKEKIKNNLIAGVRLIDSEGNVQSVPKELNVIVDEQTTIDDAFQQFDNVRIKLKNYVENFEDEETDFTTDDIDEETDFVADDIDEETDFVTDDIDEETDFVTDDIDEYETTSDSDNQEDITYYQTENGDLFFYQDSENNPVENDTNATSIAIVDEYGNILSINEMDMPELDETFENDDDTTSEERQVNQNPIEILKNDFSNNLIKNVPVFKIDFPHKSLDFLEKEDIREISEIKPIVEATKESIDQRIEQANQKITVDYNNIISDFSSKGIKRLTNDVDRIMKQTSIDGDTSFKNALNDLNKDYEEQRGKVETIVDEHMVVVQTNYNESKNNYIKVKIKEIEQEYEDLHSHIILEKEEEIRSKLINDIDKQLIDGKENIKKQAIEQQELALTHVVPRIITSLNDELKTQIKNYSINSDKLITETLQENRIELSQLKERTFDIVQNSLKRQKDIDDDVKKGIKIKTQKLDTLSIENENLRLKLESALNNETNKKEQIEELKKHSSFMSNELTQLHTHYNNVALSKTQEQNQQLQNQLVQVPTNINTLNKLDGLDKNKLALCAMGCLTIIVSAFLFTSNNKQEQPVQYQPIIENSKIYDSKEADNLKIGDTIKIQVDKDVVEASVKKIDSTLATVQTKEGNEYVVSLTN